MKTACTKENSAIGKVMHFMSTNEKGLFRYEISQTAPAEEQCMWNFCRC